tara:strand:- start:60 stop:617 length:558 start_codon:yes stop_codon:yes gene_type:complete
VIRIEGPILLGIGSNLPGPFGCPRGACGAALEALRKSGLQIIERSPWYESAPVPISNQPYFVNGVVSIKTNLGPKDLLNQVLEIEAKMGRKRTKPNAARVIDLDVLAQGNLICRGYGGAPVLPHPRLHERAFVIFPLADIFPDWEHPIIQSSAQDIKTTLLGRQKIHQMTDAYGLFGTEWRTERN